MPGTEEGRDQVWGSWAPRPSRGREKRSVRDVTMKQADALGEDQSRDWFGVRRGAGGTMVPKASRHALRGNTESDVQSKAPLEGRGGKGGQALVVEMQAPLQPRGGPKSHRMITLCTP